MKLVSFETNQGSPGFGLVMGDQVADLTAAFAGRASGLRGLLAANLLGEVEAAAKGAELGLKVGYHNHDHELSGTIDGTPVLELFAGLLDPSVLLEVDLYWATAGGADPVELLGRLGDRVIAVHVKDGPIKPGITSRQLPKDQAPAGQGDVPLAAALKAATSAQYAVIEFDHYEGDTFAGIAPSSAPLFVAAQLLGAAAGFVLVRFLFPDAAVAADRVVVPHATTRTAKED